MTASLHTRLVPPPDVRRVSAAAVTLAGVFAAALGLAADGRAQGGRVQRAQQVQWMQVTVVDHAEGPWPAAVETRTLPTEPHRGARLKSPATGRVKSIEVQQAQEVKEGTLLVELDVPGVAAALARAEARVARRQAEHGLALQDIEAARLQVERAESGRRGVRHGIDEMKQRLDAALVHHDSVKALADAGRATAEALRQAELDLTRARASAKDLTTSLEDADLALEMAKVAQTRAGLAADAAAAAVDEAFAMRQCAEETLAATRIRAPIDGVVRSLGVSVGETVRQFETEIAEVVDPSRVRMPLHVDHAYVERVDVGTKVWIQGGQGATPHEPEESVIVGIAVGLEHDAKGQPYLPTIVEFNNSDRRWILGDRCRAWIFPSAGTPAPMVPASAVIERNGKSVIYLIRSANPQGHTRAIERVVLTGRRAGTNVEILGKFRPHEKVIVDPPAELTNKSQVEYSQ